MDTFNIAGRINSTSAEHIVTDTHQLFDDSFEETQYVINQSVREDIEELKQSQGGDGNGGAAILRLNGMKGAFSGPFEIDNAKGLSEGFELDEIKSVEDFESFLGYGPLLQKPIIIVCDSTSELSQPVIEYDADPNGYQLKTATHTIHIGIETDKTAVKEMVFEAAPLSREYYTKSETYNKQEVDSMLPQLSLYKCTQAEYDAIVSKDPDTLYIITT